MSDSETRQCQNCKTDFEITPDDEAFYQKIDVPPPTFCPECRQQRRLSWRNERVLYKNICKLCGASSISMYSLNSRVVLYCQKCWWSDNWDPMDYGMEYDFSKPFFEQYKELLRKVPLINLSVANMVRCSYCNVSEGDKDSFFASASWRNENVLYSNRVANNKDSQDLYISNYNELSYELIICMKCYKTIFSMHSNDCVESAFLFNCLNCEHCFCCTNLRNKSYYFMNQPYSKDEYEKKISQYDLGSRDVIDHLKVELERLKKNSIHRFAHIMKSVNTTGDNIIGGKNVTNGFDLLSSSPLEDSKYLNWSIGVKDVMDGGPGVGELETGYEVTDTGIQSSRNFFTSVVYSSYDVYYSINCHNTKNIFGCYGLRSKEYCILNRQYSKEEYNALIPKIKKHMSDMPYVDSAGRKYRFGEFFPAETSYFAYNETIASEYFPLSKTDALKNGYVWRDADVKDYKITMKCTDVPDNVRDVSDSITNEVIECAHAGKCIHQCVTAFRIMPQELSFYRRMNLPIPTLCPNCRHGERLEKRNPLKLWHRTCMCNRQTTNNRQQTTGEIRQNAYKNTTAHTHGSNHCPNEFQTSYSPERPEIVYCEVCYQAEVA